VKWYKHDWTAVGFAGLLMGLAFLLIGFALNDGILALIGFIFLFGGLWLLRDK
jgi:hypothetical protein